MLLHCWRRVHEDNQQKESNKSTFPSCRTRTPESPQGRAEDRPDVWHADLRVGKRQGRGEEAVIQPTPEVWEMIEDLGFKIEVNHHQPVEK